MQDNAERELVNTYEKNGMTVRVYQPKITKEQRESKQIQIKESVLKLARELTNS